MVNPRHEWLIANGPADTIRLGLTEHGDLVVQRTDVLGNLYWREPTDRDHGRLEDLGGASTFIGRELVRIITRITQAIEASGELEVGWEEFTCILGDGLSPAKPSAASEDLDAAVPLPPEEL